MSSRSRPHHRRGRRGAFRHGVSRIGHRYHLAARCVIGGHRRSARARASSTSWHAHHLARLILTQRHRSRGIIIGGIARRVALSS